MTNKMFLPQAHNDSFFTWVGNIPGFFWCILMISMGIAAAILVKNAVNKKDRNKK